MLKVLKIDKNHEVRPIFNSPTDIKGERGENKTGQIFPCIQFLFCVQYMVLLGIQVKNVCGFLPFQSHYIDVLYHLYILSSGDLYGCFVLNFLSF